MKIHHLILLLLNTLMKKRVSTTLKTKCFGNYNKVNMKVLQNKNFKTTVILDQSVHSWSALCISVRLYWQQPCT